MSEKLNVTTPVTYYKDASETEAVLDPGLYIVTSDPGGAGYDGHIDQTHWKLTRKSDGKVIKVPLNSLEQIKTSSGVIIIDN